MRLADYINNLKGSADRLMFYDGTVQAEFVNNVTVPTETEILHHQKQVFKLQRGLYGLQNNDPLIQQLNRDLAGNAGASFGYDLNNSITKIEQFVDLLNQKDYSSMISKAEELGYKATEMDQLIIDFKTFYSHLANYESMQEVKYALYPIANRLSALESYILSLSDGSIGVPPVDSLVKRITWCEYAIKGQYLEARGKKFFSDKLPKNMIVLNTGHIRGYYDIFGQFKSGGQMKEDLMIFNNGNVQVQFTLGDNPKVYTMSLTDFMKYMEERTDTDTIRLTQEGYDELQKNLIAAVQAKATRSNRLKFGNINIRTSNLERQGQALIALKDIYQEAPFLRNEHPDYTALFNYNLARNINHILGMNNNLLLTRDGVVDMYTYIVSLFDKGKYFYATDGVKLSSNKANKIAIDFA